MFSYINLYSSFVQFLTTVVCVDPSHTRPLLHPLSVKYMTQKAWHAVMWAPYDPLHTNAQNRSAQLRWVTLGEKTRDEGEQISTSTPNPFKCWRGGALLCSCLEQVSNTEETKSKDTFSQIQANLCLCAVFDQLSQNTWVLLKRLISAQIFMHPNFASCRMKTMAP